MSTVEAKRRSCMLGVPPSTSFFIVYSINCQQITHAPKQSSIKRKYTEPLLQLSRGISINGIMIAPILPLPEQNPKPLVLNLVLKDSVVRGYKIWKTSFMKNLAIDPIKTSWVILKPKLKTAAPKKKSVMDLFLPNEGWSMR